MIQEQDDADDNILTYLQKNIRYIIKLQCWVRGNRGRKQVAFMKSKQIGSAKYFTFLERQET